MLTLLVSLMTITFARRGEDRFLLTLNHAGLDTSYLVTRAPSRLIKSHAVMIGPFLLEQSRTSIDSLTTLLQL
jgi:hypothetical protein